MIKISKYGNALGLWELRVGGFEQNLQDDMGDILEFRNIMSEPSYQKNIKGRMNAFARFMENLILRNDPPTTDEEKEELKTYVQLNLVELYKEVMLRYKWTDEESIKKAKEKLEGEAEKKELGVL